MVQLEYEVIKPGDEDPDPVFDYPAEGEDDREEVLFATLFLLGLAGIYEKYKDKNANYVLKNVDKDLDTLLKEWETHADKLDDLFSTQSSKTLLDAGILQDNLNKVKLPHTINEVVLEQRTTLRGIIEELRSGLKAKAYYLKSRVAEELYNPKSNFRRAVRRTRWTTQNGFRLTLEKSKRAAQIFLYGDPLAYWITKGDTRVCFHCLMLEGESPMPLSQMPYTPLHLRCRCRVVLAKDLDLTDEAVQLTLYQYDR